ncbi:MAG: SMP-30/gluconolactonase/LRE family protein [Anaerolineae bacterium]|nr:SMP-30/gluconolactonase/LRE family protein [Thermoflexales bacterium]MDW8408867.1 SMP-30/gluconolactonase/LRE family protein [Anaerolineae bacterium]
MQPELIADYQCVVGEGPLWHPIEKRVYWTDIDTGRMFRYSPASGKHEQFYSGRPVGGFTIQADGALLLFMDRGTVAIWRTGTLTPVIDEIPDERETRFNDVFADPAGRVFCGTMPTQERPGRLYRLDTDGKLTLLLEGIGCSNGMGLTPDRRGLYYTDSTAYTIYLFDYDQASGAISNQRIFVKHDAQDGLPDGMTVDAAGNVWSAHWDGSALICYSPQGKEIQRVQFPVKKVSSVTFGGDEYMDMYVTTAGGDHKETDGADAGALFRLRLGIKGVPEYYSRIGL